MFNTVGRLVPQKALCRRLAIDPALQLKAEDFLFNVIGFRLGEYQLCRPGDAISDMTGTAVRFFKRRVKVLDEPRRVHGLSRQIGRNEEKKYKLAHLHSLSYQLYWLY